MHSKALAAVLSCLTVLSICHAQDTYDIKVYPCAQAYAPIVVDGVLDEEAWQRAPLVGGFTRYDQPELVPVQTFLRVAYDRRRVYFAVICDEPLMTKLAPIAQARDAADIFHGETIEIFVDPKHDNHYVQFGINAAGSIYDSRGTDSTWSAEVIAKTQMAEDHWTLEIAIPWEDLGVQPAPGVVIGFNVCRDRYIGAGRQWSNWSQTKANFHDPDRFAHLVLSPTAQQLAHMGAEFRKGDRQGAILVYSKSGFAQTTYRALGKEALRKLDALLSDLDAVTQREAQEHVREAIALRIEAYREELAPIRARIAGKGPIDAVYWTRTDLRLQQLINQLDDVIWAARLEALLSAI